MADKICTRFIDSDGLDVGCNLITKESLLDIYPDLVPWVKAPGLWLWGSNEVSLGPNGLLGINIAGAADRVSPVQTIAAGRDWKQVSIGYGISSSIKTDGTLWQWGRARGDNTNTQRSSPVQTVSGGTNWKQVSSGNNHTGAVKTDGTLWLWGRATNGEIGNNSIVDRSSPVQTASGGTNWKSVSAGFKHTAAVKTDGTLWLWGYAGAGQLGNNISASGGIGRSSPVQTVSAGTNWKSVSVGYSHTAAVKTDGTLWLWGGVNYIDLGNIAGRIGDNTNIRRSSPVQTVSGGTDWKSVSVGSEHTVAIKTNGTLWAWGCALCGRLGNNSSTDRSSPVQTVSGGTNWYQASAGFRHSGAIKTDGTLWMWGDGTEGRLGDGTTGNKSSPVQTVIQDGYWKQVSVAAEHSAGIRDDGE